MFGIQVIQLDTFWYTFPNFDHKWTNVAISSQEGHSDQGFVQFKDGSLDQATR